MWHRRSGVELKIEGMSCEHCAHHVENELTALGGIKSVNVDLHPEGVSTVKILARTMPSDEDLQAAVQRAGDYTVVDIVR